MKHQTARQLADEYLRLGGARRIAVDDNKTSARSWQHDPPEAERFWQDNIETLDPDHQRDVHLLLPSIN